MITQMQNYFICILLIGTIIISCDNEKTADSPVVNEIENFANEKEVIINGYTGDAMEPFIMNDGTLLFNSLNTATDVKLYHATRISDTEFDNATELDGANKAGDNLDAVASATDTGKIYWVTNLNYPETCFAGIYAADSVTDAKAIAGDFYINKLADVTPEYWTIMDAEVSRDGSRYYFVNARYDATWNSVKESSLGVANWDGTAFVKNSKSAEIFTNINDAAYLVYAPSVSADGKELFYARITKKGGTNTEICRAVRSSLTAAFESPTVLAIPGTFPEGPCISRDGKKLYYHKKNTSDGLYHVYVMTR